MDRVGEKRNLNFNDISVFLSDFEIKEQVYILDNYVWNFNTWQLLRKDLYYILKNHSYGITKQEAKTNKKGTFSILMDVSRYVFAVVACILFKRKRDIIYANSTYKLEKDEQGRYVNIFLDSLISTGAVKRYIYFETSKKGVQKRPSLFKTDVHNYAKKYIVEMLQLRIKKDEKLKQLAVEFANRLNLFGDEYGFALKIKPQDLIIILSRFKAEFDLHLFLFKRIRPKRVFMVDGMPSGVIAAAHKVGATVHEFQHGFISYNKHDYMLSGYLASVKQQLACPDRVYVFGEFFRKQLLSNGFWNENEVYAIGNYRIEQQRKAVAELQTTRENVAGKVRILLATQLTTFEKAKEIVTGFVELSAGNIELSIKCHPREPESHKNWFHSIAQNNPGLVKYINAENSLVQSVADHDLLASFHSTAIFEALALGIPCITIATEKFPLGVNSLVKSDLSGVIKPIGTSLQLVELCGKFEGKEFRDKWLKECQQYGSELYARNYFDNIHQFFA